MNILALDLGTKMGYCQNTDCGLVSGTWQLATDGEIARWGKDRSRRTRDPRIIRLFRQLQVVNPRPDLVAFEDVEFQTYTYQTQLWSSFRAAVWLAFPDETVLDCVPVGTLKKFATGYAKADKALMAKWLGLRHPEISTLNKDDNEIDAIWIYLWAKTNLGRMPLPRK